MKLLTCFLTLLFYNGIAAQHYIDYQRLFNRIDEDLLVNDLPSALQRLDTIDAAYGFVYARHCIKALEISCKAGDSLRAEKWLVRSFKRGVPIWMVRNNRLMDKTYGYSNTRTVFEKYDSLHLLYEQAYDHRVRAELDSMIRIDQEHTNKLNSVFVPLRLGVYFRWKKNNVRQFERIRAITEQYGYPGERLAGLPQSVVDSAISYKYYSRGGANPRETAAFTMLIHYFSNPRRDINELLLANIESGYLPPDFYGTWNDFMARWGKGKYGDYAFYNVWHRDEETEHRPQINERRKAIGLNSFEQQERNWQLHLKARDEKTVDLQILLE